MKDYTKFLTWAVCYFVDRKTQDDNRSKLNVEALFCYPSQAKEDYTLHNKEVKRYLVHISDLEAFEQYYNDLQDGKNPKNDKLAYIYYTRCNLNQ
jgi:hypothetical protein